MAIPRIAVGVSLFAILACGEATAPPVVHSPRASDLALHAQLAPDTLAPSRGLVPILVVVLRNLSSDRVLVAPYGSSEASGIVVCVNAAEGLVLMRCTFDPPTGPVIVLEPGDSVQRAFDLGAFVDAGGQPGDYIVQAGYVPTLPETDDNRVSSNALSFVFDP